MGNCMGKQQAQEGPGPAKPGPKSTARRQQAWEKTGMVILRDQALKEADLRTMKLPDNTTLVDCSSNQLITLTPAVGTLPQLQQWSASHNRITSIPEDALRAPKLKTLRLNHNLLDSLPSLSGLTNLQQLYLDSNQLQELPDSLSTLTRLSLLSCARNRLRQLPAGLGACTALEDVEFSGNKLQALPASTADLSRLKALRLDSNDISVLPQQLLQGCSALQTLSLHDNPITPEVLQKLPGYADYERRRQHKADKVITGSAMVAPSTLDEGIER